MAQNQRVTSATSTHIRNSDRLRVDDSEFGLVNNQKAQMLIDPEEYTSGFTHSRKDVSWRGPKRVPTTAAVHDMELPEGSDTVHLDNDVDPAAGYLQKESGMPVIDTAAAAEFDDDDDEFADVDASVNEDDFSDIQAQADDAEDEFDDVQADVHDEFDDLPTIQADAELDIPEENSAELVGEDFEGDDAQPTESIALVDVDSVPDDDDTDLQFATVASSVHVIRANRIIASMGAISAKRTGMSDVYLSDQFQDVVAHAVGVKGLRKGLVQSGFVLAKVKLAASKTASVVQAKVQAAVDKKLSAIAKSEQAMDQCLAIASVGINRRFFKDTANELKAGLETEFSRAGVRGASTIIRAMFAQHGVSYARSILTLASKLSTMPEQVRNQYAEALDLTDEGDFEPDELSQELADDDTNEGDFDDIPTSVTAALSHPARRDAGILLKAGVRSPAAMSILSGTQSLV